MAITPDSPQRLVLMTTLAAVMAPLAYLLGFPESASGIIAGTPVALINYRMNYMALRAAKTLPSNKGLMLIWQRSLLRLGNDMVVLVAAALLGAEFLIGVLIGLMLELLTYYVDVGRLVLSICRGDSGCSVKRKFKS